MFTGWSRGQTYSYRFLLGVAGYFRLSSEEIHLIQYILKVLSTPLWITFFYVATTVTLHQSTKYKKLSPSLTFPAWRNVKYQN
jgi:hypothetical protein